MRNLTTDSQGVKDFKYGKIMLSNVMVTRKRNLFMGRTWTIVDVKIAVLMLAVHLLVFFAPCTFTWGAFSAGFTSYVVRELFGICLSYHRNLAHQSLKLPKWLEYTFAYFGVLASQVGSLIAATFLKSINYQERNNVEDLKNQAFYRFIKRTYLLHQFALAALVYFFGGFTYLVWVVGVGTTCGYHMTFLVNSVCHIWGNQAWNTSDLSKNNWWVALLTFGEGWHNNHHAFEYSARHGLEWWQIDVCWYVIRFLKAVGLATNVKLPTEDHKLKKSFPYLNKFM